MAEIVVNKDQVALTLRNILDPVSGQDLISANRVANITVEGSQIQCSLAFSQSLSEQQKSTLNFACTEALERRFPGHTVHIHLETQTVNRSGADGVVPQIKNIIAVASGKGGVGKSTVSTNLAISLQQAGYAVGLMDADLYGPSVPTMLGLEGQKPKLQDVHGKAKMVPLVAHGLHVISIGFIIEPEQAVVLRGPRLGGIIKQFVQECIWPTLDYLIIDLPPGTGDIQLTLVQSVSVTGAVIVTTPQKVAVADAIKAMNMFRLPSINVPILGVVENMAWFTPLDAPDKKYYLFGKGGGQQLAAMADSMLLGQVPLTEAMRQASDDGKPLLQDAGFEGDRNLWRAISSELVKRVMQRNAAQDPTQIVQVKT